MSVIKVKLTGTYSLSSLNEKFDSNALEISEAFIQSNSFSRELYFSWLIWSASNSENSLFMVLTQFESLFSSINLSFLKIFELKDFQNLLLLFRNHFLRMKIQKWWFFCPLRFYLLKSMAQSLTHYFQNSVNCWLYSSYFLLIIS